MCDFLQVYSKGIVNDPQDLAARLETSLSSGLTSSALLGRAERFGSNKLPEREQASADLSLLQDQALHDRSTALCVQVQDRLLGTMCRSSWQVSFWELLTEAFQDFTIIVLLTAAGASIALEAAFGKEGDNGWIEGVAILAAVAVVTLVTAVNNYQKEKQFRELSALADANQVSKLSCLLSQCGCTAIEVASREMSLVPAGCKNA